MSDCIFCDIIPGKSPASFVYEDDVTIAIMDLYPINPGQVVAFPRKHVVYLADMDEATGIQLFRTVQRTCQAIRTSGIACDGVNLFLADGEAAGQEVFHLHFLIIPRLKGDSMKIACEQMKPTRQELDDYAALIRTALETL